MGFYNFPAFPRYLGQFCWQHSIKRKILHWKYILDIFLEHLGLGTSKLNNRAKNEAKNRENVQKAPLSLFEAEILQKIITFSIEYFS